MSERGPEFAVLAEGLVKRYGDVTALDHLDLAPTNPLNYEAEDQQVALYREFLPRLAAVEHVEGCDLELVG